MRLWGRGAAVGVTQRVIGRLVTEPVEDPRARRDSIPYVAFGELGRYGENLSEYAGLLCTDDIPRGSTLSIPAIARARSVDYLDAGDVVLIHPSGMVSVMYRRNSRNNTILTTERCNSFCLMCSQPPKAADDSYRVPLILRLLELIDRGATELVVSGGEPTLLGDDFFSIIARAEQCLPSTAIHVLTNGRRFADREFAARLARIQHHDLMLGIPLYSDIDARHDYVVQARGAFDQTMDGFYNLGSTDVALEVRVVIHKQTYTRLPRLAEFISRNLPFVDHVALMGLEMFGFTPQNLDVLWIDPADYASQLEEATLTLAMNGMAVSIYNHQLCTIPKSLWPYARKSISDWKNVYLDECDECAVRPWCGGFFQSATKRHSAHIHSMARLTEDAESFMAELHPLARDGGAELTLK